MSVALDIIHASGHRKSWWMRVESLSAKPARGLKGVNGEVMEPGEHALAVGTALLHIVPDGSVRANRWVAHLHVVGPSTDKLQLYKEERFDWQGVASCHRMRDVIREKLVVRDRLLEVGRKLQSVFDGVAGSVGSHTVRQQLTDEVAAIFEEHMPLRDVEVEVSPTQPYRLVVSFTATGTAGKAPNLIRCAVPGYDGSGEPSILYITVRAPADYDYREEEDLLDREEDDPPRPHHYEAARVGVRRVIGADVLDGVPVFDDISEVGRLLLAEFDWSTSSVVDLEGNLEDWDEGGEG